MHVTGDPGTTLLCSACLKRHALDPSVRLPAGSSGCVDLNAGTLRQVNADTLRQLNFCGSQSMQQLCELKRLHCFEMQVARFDC